MLKITSFSTLFEPLSEQTPAEPRFTDQSILRRSKNNRNMMFFGHSFGQNPPPGSQAASNLRHRCEKYTKTNRFCVSYFSQKFSKGRNQYPRTCAHCQTTKLTINVSVTSGYGRHTIARHSRHTSKVPRPDDDADYLIAMGTKTLPAPPRTCIFRQRL